MITLLIIAVVLPSIAFFGIIAQQKNNFKKLGKIGESYRHFCDRYYSHYL